MKVMLVNGSPHKEGCTYTVLTEIAKVLNEEKIDTEIFWTGNKPVSGCIGCNGCDEADCCILDDTSIISDFLNAAQNADGFIFGTPVHYAAASGTITSFLDRVFYSDGKKTFYLKPGAAVAIARRAGTTATLDQMNKYFTISQMPVISSRYWNMVHGAKPEDIKKDAEGIYTMRVLARNMTYFLKCKEAGERAGIELPKEEQPSWTNFIR